jgi:hypothetical protein
MDAMASTSKIQDANLPPGYVLDQAADRTFFAVPGFMVPATHVAFEAYRGKNLIKKDIHPEVGDISFLYSILKFDIHGVILLAVKKTWIAFTFIKCWYNYGSS